MLAAIVFRSEEPVPGRELALVQLMHDADAFFEKAEADGLIADFAWYVSAQGGPNYLIVRGEMEKLSALSGDREFAEFSMRSARVTRDFSWSCYSTGETVERTLGLFQRVVASLP